MRLFILILLFLNIPLMATGPRISSILVTPDKKEIFALDFPPFVSRDIKNGGMLNELVVAVLKEAKMEAIVTTVPIQSMIKYYLTQENTFGVLAYDASLTAVEKKSLIAIPLYVTTERYFYYAPAHKRALKYEGKLSNLKGLTYGASKGEEVSVYKRSGINVKKARTLSLFKKLQNSTVDFISLPTQTAKWFMENKFSKCKNDFKSMKTQSGSSKASIYFNLNHSNAKENAKSFTKALKTIVENGTYSLILSKYITSQDEVKLQLKHMQKNFK